MFAKEIVVYLNDVPRYALGVVFLWFGIDKFVLHEFYVSWFSATERITILLPTADFSTSIYILGIIELILAVLLFSGLWVRIISIIVIFFLIMILATAQYPSSFPQDIGLIGFAAILTITNVSWKKAHIDKFLKFLWVIRYPLVVVLVLWAIDQTLNPDIHIGWIKLSSPIIGNLNADGVELLLATFIVLEIALAGTIAIGKVSVTKYSLLFVTCFFVFGIVAQVPPLNNHQTVGFAMVTAWLTYIAFSKNRV